MTYQQFSNHPGDWLSDTVQRKPEALLLIAAGCALLMRSGHPSMSVASATGDGPATASARDRVNSGVGDSARASASKVAEAVSGYICRLRKAFFLHHTESCYRNTKNCWLSVFS